MGGDVYTAWRNSCAKISQVWKTIFEYSTKMFTSALEVCYFIHYFFLVELDFEISHFSAIDDAAREAKRIYLKEGNAPIPSRDEMGVVRFRISRSAVHDEFVPVELFHKRLGTNVEGRRCLHCDEEFLNKNKTNLDDHLKVFHADVYQRALGK